MAEPIWEWIAGFLERREEGREAPVPGPGAAGIAAQRVLDSCLSLERDLSNLSLALTGHPDRAGPWVLVRPLGRGPAGTVYLGENDAGEAAAVRLLEGPGTDVLLDAAARVAGWSHPGAVEVHSFGDGWIASEPSGGVPLSRVLLPLSHEPDEGASRALLATLAPVADALDEAKIRGLVHAGVSTRKIDVHADGALKIRDFGHDPTRGSRPPGPETPPLGAPSFLAPEQVTKGGEVSFATDVYSIGAVAWAIATGCPPVAGRSLTGVLAAIRAGVGSSVAEAASWVPADLGREIDAALAVDPSRRPRSLDGLKAAIAAL